MTKHRVVLDTNIYLSGIIFGGNCRQILDLVIEKKIISFTALPILLELSEKLSGKFHWDKGQIITTIKIISNSVTLVSPKQKLDVIKADKSDNKIIEAAVAADADFIITGDKHLLGMKRYKEIKTVSPAQFLKLL